MDFFKDGESLVLIDTNWYFFRLAETQAEDAVRLIGKLLFVYPSSGNEVDEREQTVDSERACRTRPQEDVDQVEHAVLEVCCLPLSVSRS